MGSATSFLLVHPAAQVLALSLTIPVVLYVLFPFSPRLLYLNRKWVIRLLQLGEFSVWKTQSQSSELGAQNIESRAQHPDLRAENTELRAQNPEH